VPQFASGRPLREANLGDKLRFDAMDALARWLVADERAGGRLQLRKPAAQLLQPGGVESRSNLACVDQLSAMVIAH